MGKLHEVLSVEPDLKAAAMRAMNNIKALFSSGQGRFVGQVRRYRPLEEDGPTFADDSTSLSTTVMAELAEFLKPYGRWMDAALQKEITNRETGANIVIDGKVVLGNMTAPSLLNIESKLAELRSIYTAIPTNDPAEQWDWDKANGCYIAGPKVTYRGRKVRKSHVLYEATPEHPAQVESYTEDIRVGQWDSMLYSGMITPTNKREILERLDNLIRATKQARQRANNIDATTDEYADALFAYINGG